MTKAETILKKKDFLKNTIRQNVSEEQTEQIWNAAEVKLNEVLKRYNYLPKGVRAHTEEFIFPSAAVYLVMKERLGREEAYRIFEEACIVRSENMGNKLAGLMKTPGMTDVFLKVWEPLTKKKFGKSSGFENVYYPKEKDVYRMDITACPYCRYLNELGCGELTKVFCDNDERCYGNLPGIIFKRTGTLGKGNERCDFSVRRVPKEAKQVFLPEEDGFYGVWYPNGSEHCEKAMIAMLGDSSDDYLAVTGVKWLQQFGCHVLAMSPSKKDYGHHSYPLERFGKAIEFLKSQGCEKIGIVGASTTGMLALTAASYYPDITLTIAMSPSDFIMEGFYRDGLDGAEERPGDFESSVTWQGKQLPFLPYAYRHPEYWQKLKEEAKNGGNKAAAREMFDESERRHPLQEDEKIKVEKIHGKVICIGAEDDVLWDTCRYIRRMEKRLAEMPHECTFEAWTYEHGTHFVFPESMLRKMLPVGSKYLVSFMFKAAKEHPEECTRTRQDIDRKLRKTLEEW